MNLILMLAMSATGFAQTPAPEASPAPGPQIAIETPAPTPAPDAKTLVEPPAPPSAPVSLAPHLSFQLLADLRYRHIAITDGNYPERRQHQLLARLGARLNLQENLAISIRMMTGTKPNSGNQTLGDEAKPGMPRRDFGLDWAYADYKPASWVNLYLGRMPQFFYFAGKNQLILDRDLALEGAGTQLRWKAPAWLEGQVNLGSYWIREKYNKTDAVDETDSFLNVAQLNLKFKAGDWSFIAGQGVFSYTGVKDGKPSNFFTGANDLDPRGNTLDLLNNYAWNYELSQTSLEVKWKKDVFEASVFGEMVQNSSADDFNKAQLMGASVGWKQWSLTYLDQKLERDSVFALFTDSDFANGETDSKGTITTLAYKMTPQATLSFAVYKQKRGMDAAFSTDYDRSQLDLTLTY